MPFISKDWRSPGEAWVKTEEGWEKMKILETCEDWTRHYPTFDTREDNKENRVPDLCAHHHANDVTTSSDQNPHHVQPHCHITIKCTREIAGFNRLSDALKRLDFRNAVRDVRRFHYICKLIDLLITRGLTTMSGCAQKALFAMLEEVAAQVRDSQQHMHILDGLLGHLQQTLLEYYCWGRPLGSTALWERHLAHIHRIHSIAKGITIKEPGDDVFPKLHDLPEECLREILLRLADHRDLESSGQAYPAVLGRLLGEQRIWRELCAFHFTQDQINTSLQTDSKKGLTALSVSDDNEEHQLLHVDWQRLYHKLRRQYGLREEYAEVLHLCRNCRCLFWRSIGHPCIISSSEDSSTEDEEPPTAPGWNRSDLMFRRSSRRVLRVGEQGRGVAAAAAAAAAAHGNVNRADEASPNPLDQPLYVPIPPQAFLKFFSL